MSLDFSVFQWWFACPLPSPWNHRSYCLRIKRCTLAWVEIQSSQSMMSPVGNGSLTVDCFIAVSVHCNASWNGILVNSDFKSKDTSLSSSGICTVLVASIKFSVDCSLRLDLSVRGCGMVVKYLDSWYVGDPQNDTIGRIGIPCLCSFGSP